MNREPDPDGAEFPDEQLPADQPPAEPEPDEFDAIVAGWLRDGGVPRWPDDPGLDGPRSDDPRFDDGRPDDPRPDGARPDSARPDGARPDDPRPDSARPGPGDRAGSARPGPAGTDPEFDLDLEMERLAAPLFDVTPAPAPPPPPARVEDDEEHFVPPEPPPLPRIGPPALVGLTLIVLGLVLTVSPGWVGVPTPYGLPLGLMSIASGLGWLVLRLWPDHSDDDAGYAEPDEDDDGAIL